MQRIITLAAVAAVAIAATPALAKSKKHHRMQQNQYEQSYNGPGWNGGWQRQGWNSRNVSDPSFGNRAGINYARGTGRCVTDLGYGRFEYCGW